MKWKVVLSDIDITSAELKAVQKVLKSRWLSMGAATSEFEKSFARFIGVKHALAVSNGTAALHLALLAGGVKPGEEVLAPSLTFVATVNSILYCGAKPVFVDICGPENPNVSPLDLERKITEKTKAILVVHYAGYPADMPRIRDIVATAETKFNHKIALIEDAAHAPGAEMAGTKCGAWGDLGCFSFFANKNLVTGEGGMIVTDSDDLAAKLKLMRSHGMTSLSWQRHQGHARSYDVVRLGYNFRLTEIEAALGLEQLKKLKASNLKRRRLVELYHKNLNRTENLSIPFQRFEGKSSYHILPVILSGQIDRSRFIEILRQMGIQTSIHYPPVHLFTYYQQRFPNLRLPQTELVAAREVTLPLHPRMKPADVNLVCRAVKQALRQAKHAH